jgi:hypothetical protein
MPMSVAIVAETRRPTHFRDTAERDGTRDAADVERRETAASAGIWPMSVSTSR